MNRYSRILHHLDIEDVKLKCLDEIAAREIEEKNRKFEEEFITKKMDWYFLTNNVSYIIKPKVSNLAKRNSIR